MNDIGEADLQRYIDGETDPEARARIERYLAARPAEDRRVRETREDMALLRRYFTALDAHIPDRHIADTVRLVVDHAPRRRFSGMGLGLRTAAMVAFLLVGSVAVLGIKVLTAVPAFADAAALAYQEVTRQPAEAADDAVADPGWLIDWLNRSTGLVIRAPSAEQHGFRLTDGRLTRFDHNQAGLLVYEDGRHHRVVVFVTRVAGGKESRRHFAFDRSTYINYWSHDGVGAVIAAADRRDLKEFTRATETLIDVSAMPVAVHPH